MVGGKIVGVELANRDSDINAIPAIALEDLRKFLVDGSLFRQYDDRCCWRDRSDQRHPGQVSSTVPGVDFICSEP